MRSTHMRKYILVLKSRVGLHQKFKNKAIVPLKIFNKKIGVILAEFCVTFYVCNTVSSSQFKFNVFVANEAITDDLLKLEKLAKMFKRKEIRSASGLQACWSWCAFIASFSSLTPETTRCVRIVKAGKI